MGRIAAFLYGVYAWGTFVVGICIALLGVLLVPGVERRRRWVSACARGFFRAAGITTVINGREHLPETAAIVVANHASYLDGVILQAYLPPRFSYVIKSEMQNVPVAHFLLRRIDARFVERFKASSRARDARRLIQDAKSGSSLAVFPEGTFIEQPGLGKFYRGAFASALSSARPIVPVVIHGSRHLLPAGRWLPRHGPLTIDILAPLEADPTVYADPRALAAAARERMLQVLDEPDLLAETASDQPDAAPNA